MMLLLDRLKMQYAIPLREMFDAFQAVFRLTLRSYDKINQPFFELDEKSIETLTGAFKQSRQYGMIWGMAVERDCQAIVRSSIISWL
jgi:hypothetical protein